MTENIIANSITQLNEHSAVKAWCSSDFFMGKPKSVEVLKEHKKSRVYRLKNVGPEQLNIIAKGCKSVDIQTEKNIYEYILPKVSVPSLKYYGSARDEKLDVCWVFLQDAKGESFRNSDQEHRLVAIDWLARLHRAKIGNRLVTMLPDRTLNYHYHVFQSAKRNITECRINNHLKEQHKQTLNVILEEFNKLEMQWNKYSEFCQLFPNTLIHGDFGGQNVRILNSDNNLTLLPYDWELSGWGEFALDLGSFRPSLTDMELKLYHSKIFSVFPDIDFNRLRKYVRVGKLMRIINEIAWTSTGLKFEWLIKTMDLMGLYLSELTIAIDSILLD